MSDDFFDGCLSGVSAEDATPMLREMLTTARAEGLEAEVVAEAMHQYRSMEAPDLERACVAAMLEWDL